MRILLDTHALIWWSGDTTQIASKTRNAIGSAEQILVSVVSVYEMTLKHQLGKLPGVAELLPDLRQYLGEQGFAILPLDLSHANLAGRLPLVHRDPFDRMLIAQALTEDLTIVSNETLFDQFGVRRLW